jgi:tetratricopeptide (TPR) repeat protein
MSYIKKYHPNRIILLIFIIVCLFASVIYSYKYLSTQNANSNLSVRDSQNSAKDVPQNESLENTLKDKRNSNNDIKTNTLSTPSTTSVQSDGQVSITSPPSSSDENQKEALALYDQGLKLYYERNYNAALAQFNKALAIDPNCYQAINGKGASYAFLGRYSEGISLVKQAIKMKPDFEYGYFNLGLSNELAGKWNDAISAYETAIKLNSKDEWAFYGIASIYGRQGNIDMVVKYLQQAIAIDPGVKDSAREEKDFNPVRNNPQFKALIQ